MNVNPHHTAVDPVRPAAAYIGGKRNLSRRLIDEIAGTPHDGYAEPFVGMGGVFLRRRMAPPMEVINDISGDVATFFRILQRHYPQFMEMLRFQIASRREFERLIRTDPDTLTDLERAARFLYLQRLAFGGKVEGRSFGVQKKGSARFDVSKLGSVLEDIHERLSGVVIEQLPWHSFMDRYDRPGMLFYLDPPYHGCEEDYGKAVFDQAAFVVMAERLRKLKGRFLMSINDTPAIRTVFEGFSMEPVPVTYTISKGSAGQFRELIITG